MFVAGGSGSGKSTTLLRLALDDLDAGRMVVVLDPHGDLAPRIAHARPDCAASFTVVDPRVDDTARLDLLGHEPAHGTAHLMSAVTEVWPADFSGPMWQRGSSLALRVLHDAHVPMTPAALERFFVDPKWRWEVIACLAPGALAEEAAFEARNWQREPSGDGSISGWMASKLTPLTRGPAAPLFAAPASRPLEDELRHGTGLLVSLPVGELGSETVRLTGRMFLSRLTTAIAAQGAVPEQDRRPISVLIDEAHLLAGPAMGAFTAQARKFHASVTVATQAPSQLGGHLAAILTNTEVMLLSRLPGIEARLLEDRIGGPAACVLSTLRVTICSRCWGTTSPVTRRSC